MKDEFIGLTLQRANTEPECGVRFKPSLNIEPEHGVRSSPVQHYQQCAQEHCIGLPAGGLVNANSTHEQDRLGANVEAHAGGGFPAKVRDLQPWKSEQRVPWFSVVRFGRSWWVRWLGWVAELILSKSLDKDTWLRELPLDLPKYEQSGRVVDFPVEIQPSGSPPRVHGMVTARCASLGWAIYLELEPNTLMDQEKEDIMVRQWNHHYNHHTRRVDLAGKSRLGFRYPYDIGNVVDCWTPPF
ncbi:hypothetical protein C8R46DRAFT_1028468 [Mycena filopes]|nr:hypothetical protein C8R46DRAFT_1028468 [Mycena filopes]